MAQRFYFLGLQFTANRGESLQSHLLRFRFCRNDEISKTLRLDVANVFRRLRLSIRPSKECQKRYFCYGVVFDDCYLDEFDNILRDFSLNCHLTEKYTDTCLSIFHDVVRNLIDELESNLK